jgi:hypothetical protein
LVKSFNILILFILSVPALLAQSDPNTKVYTASISKSDTLIELGVDFVMQYSDKLTINDSLTLKPAADYRFDYRNGVIILSRSLFANYSLDTARTYSLRVEYDIFPYTFKEEYSNFEIETERDTITGDTVEIATQNKDLIENLFEGTELDKSGSLFRGFTFGSNRDLSLNSGFRLQLNGKLSSDVDIVAALTDEDTPIQPEGNTQKLQELDKVFIELKSNNVITTIGDIDINLANSEFVNFNRKIQGAKGFGDFNFGNLFLAGAVSRGKFNTNSFNGIDGVQGPYRLIGADNEVNILVLSGTERVYIDGILMTRGDNADYTIDYGIGEVTFTNRRLITDNTRIVVDFEYSDRRYSRTLIAGNNNMKFFGDKLTLGVSYVNEFDNKDKTIDFSLSDFDKEVISNAGGDRSKAVKTGVSDAGTDPATGIGKGLYVKSDSAGVTIYRFQPGTDTSVYQVNFSFTGTGNYIKKSSVEYVFAGLNKGTYDTVVFLPIPTSYQVANVSLDYSPSRNRDFYVRLETAYSDFDANKFSDIASSKERGVALTGIIGLAKQNFKLFGMDVRGLNLSFKNRVINRAFNSLDRISSVEFNRNFNVEDSSKLTEDYREGLLQFAPNNNVNVNYNFGQLRRGQEFDAMKHIGDFEFKGDSLGLPTAYYRLESVNSTNGYIDIDGKWIKHLASLGYKKYLTKNSINNTFLELIALYNAETKRDIVTGGASDSLRFGSFAFNEVIPRVSLNNFYDFDLYAEYIYRKDEDVNAGFLYELSNSYTQRYGLVYKGLNWLGATVDVAVRDRYFSDIGKEKGNIDNNSVLVSSQVRVDPFNSAIKTDLTYDVSSERTARTDRVFVFVGIGRGNYRYLGDLNANGLQDENEFEPVNFDGDYVRLNIPLDEFFPTVDLRTSARVNFKPSRFFNLAGGFLAEVFNNLSTESFFRIDEKSKDPNTNNIYFLRFNTFLNDTNTLQGLQLFQQDINFFENNDDYSFRLRYIEQKGFSQFSSGNERQLSIERSARVKLGVTEGVFTQFDYFNKLDRNLAAVNSIRNRNISSEGVTADIAYRPVQEIETGFQFNFTRARDVYPVVPTDADINQQILRFIYSFTGVGRLRLELERDEVLLASNSLIIPYELTSGRVAGKSYFWRSIFDYSITKNIQASIFYDGRIEGNRRAIHTGNAQLTAFF